MHRNHKDFLDPIPVSVQGRSGSMKQVRAPAHSRVCTWLVQEQRSKLSALMRTGFGLPPLSLIYRVFLIDGMAIITIPVGAVAKFVVIFTIARAIFFDAYKPTW
jgi:hypothetical protein